MATQAFITADHFRGYPPEARALAVAHLPLLQQLPQPFLGSLLQELVEYDWKFPLERTALQSELEYLQQQTSEQLQLLLREFHTIQLAAEGDRSAWIRQPLAGNEQFSAYLWSSHQMEQFQAAAAAYGEHLQRALPATAPEVPRLGIAVIGGGVAGANGSLFARLRPHGIYFCNVDPAGGLPMLLDAVAERAQRHPTRYAHWYIDGGAPVSTAAAGAITTVSYAGLEGTRRALLDEIAHETNRPGAGPESLRNRLAQLRPAQLHLQGDAVLDRFQVRLLTEGSGTQIFSTTFVQWAAREALRRAAPLTLLAHFQPRQRQRPMSELLRNAQEPLEMDPAGSLVDADMAAYYQWINQQRLSGAGSGAFVAWFEGNQEAVALGPTLPRGTESASPLNLAGLVRMATGA